MEKLRQANKTYYFETMKERYDVKENEYQASLTERTHQSRPTYSRTRHHHSKALLKATLG